VAAAAWPAIARTVESTTEYPQPVAAVWRALTDPSRLGLWLMNFSNEPGEMTADFRAEPGAPFRLEARKGRGWRGYVVGRVLEAEPERRLVYTWAHSAAQDAHPIRIELTLAPTPAGTRLRMVQTGFGAGLKGWFSAKGMQMGWRKMLRTSIRPVLAQAA